MYSQEARKTMEHVNKRWVKILTVITYIISVSLVALILGVYYKLAWSPKYENENYNFNTNKLSKIESDEILNHTKDLVSLGTINIYQPHENNEHVSLSGVKHSCLLRIRILYFFFQINIKEIRSKMMNVLVESLRNKDHVSEIVQDFEISDSSSEKSDIVIQPNSINKYFFSIKINVSDIFNCLKYLVCSMKS